MLSHHANILHTWKESRFVIHYWYPFPVLWLLHATHVEKGLVLVAAPMNGIRKQVCLKPMNSEILRSLFAEFQSWLKSKLMHLLEMLWIIESYPESMSTRYVFMLNLNSWWQYIARPASHAQSIFSCYTNKTVQILRRVVTADGCLFVHVAKVNTHAWVLSLSFRATPIGWGQFIASHVAQLALDSELEL